MHSTLLRLRHRSRGLAADAFLVVAFASLMSETTLAQAPQNPAANPGGKPATPEVKVPQEVKKAIKDEQAAAFNVFFSDARTVSVDLNSGFVSKTLPFDEPFVVKITPIKLDRLTEVRLRFATTKDFKEPMPDCAEDGGPWISSSQWRAIKDNDTTKQGSLVVVPPLKPAAYYRMCLLMARRPDGEQVKAYANALVEALDRELRGISDSILGGLDPVGVRVVQRAMIRAAARMPDADMIRIRKGSIIDTTVSNGTAWEDQIRIIKSIRTLDKRVKTNSKAITDERTRIEGVQDTQADRSDLLMSAVRGAMPNIAAPVLPESQRSLLWAPADAQTIRTAFADTLAAVSTILNNPLADAPMKLLAGQIKASLEARAANADALIRTLSERSALIVSLAALMQQDAPAGRDVEVLSASTVADLTSRAKQRVSVDLGLATLYRSGHAAPYVGASFYFVPVNRDVPLALQPGFLYGAFKRPSLGLGLTTSSVGLDNHTDLLSGHSLIVDFGIRPWDAFRISTGCMLYRKTTNPLTSSTKLACTPSVGASIDDAIKDAFNGFISLIFPNS
jgi:hypothetical protein